MKSCLIVVDFQNDFVCGSLGFPAARELDGRICEKIAAARAEGGEVIFTLDTHFADYLETQEGRRLPVEHCIKGTEGHSLYGETAKAVRQGDKIFEKCAFGSDALYEYLKTAGFERVELCGLVSNICVLSNAVLAKTALPQAQVTVDALCTSSADAALDEAALNVLSGIQVDVINRKAAK